MRTALLHTLLTFLFHAGVHHRSVVGFIPGMPPRHLSALAVGVAQLHGQPPIAWPSFVLEQYHRNLGEAKASETAALVWALGVLVGGGGEGGGGGATMSWLRHYHPLLLVSAGLRGGGGGRVRGGGRQKWDEGWVCRVEEGKEEEQEEGEGGSNRSSRRRGGRPHLAWLLHYHLVLVLSSRQRGFVCGGGGEGEG